MGSISQVARFTLPNRWKVQVPYQRYATVDGEQYEGSGVPVDIEADPIVHTDCDSSTDISLKTAVECLMNSKHNKNLAP